MPNSRKRRSLANSAARRENRRRKGHARFARMMSMVEATITRKAREEGIRYCECGGRLTTFKIGGKVITDALRCRRCGRDVTLEVASSVGTPSAILPTSETSNESESPIPGTA